MQIPHPPQDFCKFLKDVSSLGHPCLQVPDSTCDISVSHHRTQNVKLSLATISKQKTKFTYTKLLTDIVDFSKKVGRDGREVYFSIMHIASNCTAGISNVDVLWLFHTGTSHGSFTLDFPNVTLSHSLLPLFCHCSLLHAPL